MEAEILNKFWRRSSDVGPTSTCITCPEERTVMMKAVGDLTDWKWEYTSAFLWDIRWSLPILVKRFDDKKFMDNATMDKNARPAHSHLRKRCRGLEISRMSSRSSRYREKM